jgi:5-formyltetrahydrofolate cyclo-ligase
MRFRTISAAVSWGSNSSFVVSCLTSLAPPQQKSTLRKELRKRRRALSAAQQKSSSRQLHRRLVTSALFRFSRRIAFTMAADGEIDPSLLLATAQRRGKECYLPVLSPIGPPRLRFKRWRKGERLRENFYGIAEPRAGRYCSPRALSLVLLPLVGFDKSGNRLGMGKGYYDRTFAFQRHSVRHCPALLGLAHECQRVDRLQVEAWDLPLEGIVTEQNWYRAP